MSQPRGMQLARPIRGEVFLFTVKQIAGLLRGVHDLHTQSLLVHLDLYYLMVVVANLLRTGSQSRSCRYLAGIPLIVAPGLKRF